MNALRITTGARLHFGLLDVVAPFGGCGVMVDQPATVVEARRASQFGYSQVNAPVDHRDRAVAVARRIADMVEPNGPLPGVHVSVRNLAPPHSGLGSGTQLSLAISEAILRVAPECFGDAAGADTPDTDVPNIETPEDVFSASGEPVAGAAPLSGELWLRGADRGRRSAVGTHGYRLGGFLVEGVDRDGGEAIPNPLNLRLEMPLSWRVAILLPVAPVFGAGSVSGEQEQAHFDALSPVPRERRSEMTALLKDSLVPAIRDEDFERFCAATTKYNRLSGELFAPVQGGAYNGDETAALIERLLGEGFGGVGQSSWGPGVFVWHRDEASLLAFRDSWSHPGYRILTTCPKRDGRIAEWIADDDDPGK
ncbi:GHMP family kinase ATP-binding protein [Rhodopirellula sallentina]|uniref:Beta-ribofuranosylaminobenzene 5'-phosphate synthase family n=1 Tax=Rhodopirellula sallentina SM41 TaxID=1263870 RepID=M5TTR5_9BACT|nr:beta-ribofuranosylaminobenzene 5'-phosphate synthase family [Rhodopirellula sallentina]EMI52444.1 beta-ribofuranosylaminobenzene 5'-phosphate synthase family [Rhodopirellula sallentina SM41]